MSRTKGSVAPMSVAFVAPGAGPSEVFGGRGHYAEKMGRVLAAQGHQVSVVHAADEPGTSRADGVRYIGVVQPPVRRGLGRLLRGRFRRTLNSLGFGWAALRAVRRLARDGDLDVAVVINNQATGLLVQIGAPVPVVLSCRAYMPRCNELKYRSGMDQRLVERLEALSMDMARWAYAPSELTASLYNADRRQGHPIQVIRTPVDPELGDGDQSPSRAEGDEVILFFTGLLEDIKGGHVLAEAFERLHRQAPGRRLIVVGRDRTSRGVSARDRMRELAGAAAPGIEFIGFVGRQRLRELILSADVVALPSLFDNLPNTLLESLQLGAVVVGSRIAT